MMASSGRPTDRRRLPPGREPHAEVLLHGPFLALHHAAPDGCNTRNRHQAKTPREIADGVLRYDTTFHTASSAAPCSRYTAFRAYERGLPRRLTRCGRPLALDSAKRSGTPAPTVRQGRAGSRFAHHPVLVSQTWRKKGVSADEDETVLRCSRPAAGRSSRLQSGEPRGADERAVDDRGLRGQRHPR